MQIAGRRIHVAGSTAPDTDEALIRYAHDLVDVLIRELAERGATFAVGVGKEPLARPDDPSSPAIVFDWTVLAALGDCLARGFTQPASQGRLVATIATAKTDRHIPDTRQPLWDGLNAAGAVTLDHAKSGWASGAYRRAALARLGDVLIVLGGGEGVEHLAELYAAAQKPVIALDLDLGSSTGDGSGGAKRLAGKMLADPAAFLRLSDPAGAGSLLRDLTTRQGTRPVREAADAVVRLVEALAPPMAFFVRLLNPDVKEFSAVERFFRDVVEPLVTEFGFDPLEMGRGPNPYAWMNQAIFDSLHHAAVVVVDLTGLRTNCFMELGYALGNAQRVIVTARAGTRPPFDAAMIETHYWSPRQGDARRIAGLRAHWERNIDRPSLVRPRQLV
jgi:ATP nucleosidase Cap17-like protein